MAWEDRSVDCMLHEINELREQCRQQEWQPIETAPMVEYADVLLVDADDFMYVGYWSWIREGRGFWTGGADDEPTHWMPLPAPPKSKV